MDRVMSLRLKENELGYIKELSKIERTGNSEAARELIKYGWEYYIFKLYKSGKISMGKMAELLNITISELIDKLAELGIESPITYEDFLEGISNLKKIQR